MINIISTRQGCYVLITENSTQTEECEKLYKMFQQHSEAK